MYFQFSRNHPANVSDLFCTLALSVDLILRSSGYTLKAYLWYTLGVASYTSFAGGSPSIGGGLSVVLILRTTADYSSASVNPFGLRNPDPSADGVTSARLSGLSLSSLPINSGIVIPCNFI